MIRTKKFPEGFFPPGVFVLYKSRINVLSLDAEHTVHKRLFALRLVQNAAAYQLVYYISRNREEVAVHVLVYLVTEMLRDKAFKALADFCYPTGEEVVYLVISYIEKRNKLFKLLGGKAREVQSVAVTCFCEQIHLNKVRRVLISQSVL